MSVSTGSDPEKGAADIGGVGGKSPTEDPALEKVWRKVDLYVVPVAAMFYLLSFLDRTNFGNARVAGLQKDLKMTNKQYSIALTVTYVPYIFAELPSNLLLKAVGPNRLLPVLLTLWGVVTTSQGAVKTYHGLLACRFFLGLLEGGVFPGLVLYLSTFYPRQKLNWRIAAFFSTASISGAFSGILAYGIIHMDGLGHLHGWAWIFILEGLFTILFGISSFFLLPRSPEDCRFLSETERLYVLQQLQKTGATGEESTDKFTWKEVGLAFMQPQVQMLAVQFFFSGSLIYGLAYFTPSIVQGLGYTAARAQLFSVPPFAAAFVVSMLLAYISDRYRCRGVILFTCGILSAIGFAMYLGSASFHVKYGSLFFSISGAYSSAPAGATWMANNSAPHTRRATAIAIAFIMTNSGGILVTWLFGTLSPAPLYRKACITMLIFSLLVSLFAGLNLWYLTVQNRKKAIIRQSKEREDEEPGLGDKSAWFIYSL